MRPAAAVARPPPDAREIHAVVGELAPALGVVGLLNVQLAVADGHVYVLEANPRASRTVPFASKAIGVNLVEAACRLAAGAKLSELRPAARARPAMSPSRRPCCRSPASPGATRCSGPEMRSTGEVMASAADFPTAFAKAERAAGRPLPAEGTAFLSVRDADKPAAVPVAAALSGSASACSRPAGTAAGARRRRTRRSSACARSPRRATAATVVDLIRRGRCDLVVNTPQGSGARTDGYLIREAALVARVPCITTLSGAQAAVHAIANARSEDALSLQERHAEARTA